LRPIELGALLSALTFHNTPGTYHSIGMAKPLGYGKLSVVVNNGDNLKFKEHLCAFEAYMNVQLKSKTPVWHKLPQVKELVLMAQDVQNDEVLGYMPLKDHPKVKNNREALPLYSKINNLILQIESQCIADSIQKMENLCKNEIDTSYHTQSIEEVVEMHKTSEERKLRQAFEQLKVELLQKLAEKRQSIEDIEKAQQEAEAQQKRDTERNERAINAAENGPDFNIELSKKDAWDNLKKAIEGWGRNAYKINNIDKIIMDNPGGYLYEAFHEGLINALKTTYQSLSKRDKQNWVKTYKQNPYLKKVAEWIGKDKAEEIFGKLK